MSPEARRDSSYPPGDSPTARRARSASGAESELRCASRMPPDDLSPRTPVGVVGEPRRDDDVVADAAQVFRESREIGSAARTLRPVVRGRDQNLHAVSDLHREPDVEVDVRGGLALPGMLHEPHITSRRLRRAPVMTCATRRMPRVTRRELALLIPLLALYVAAWAFFPERPDDEASYVVLAERLTEGFFVTGDDDAILNADPGARISGSAPVSLRSSLPSWWSTPLCGRSGSRLSSCCSPASCS